MFKDKKILFIGCHPDDIELGCGSFISNVKEDNDLYAITFGDLGLKNINRKALLSLGIKLNNIHLLSYTNRHFDTQRQMICDDLYEYNKKINPDIIFSHIPLCDMHQDHEVLSKEVLRIFKHKTVIGFESPHFLYNYTPNLYWKITEEDKDNKLKAASLYEIYKDKIYFDKKCIVANLIRNGMMINSRYAESFYILRMVNYV